MGELRVPEAEVGGVRVYFAPPPYEARDDAVPELAAQRAGNRRFDAWLRSNVEAHKQPGYAIATVSLKPHGGIPGDATAAQMEAVAAIADRFGFGEVRVSYKQNLLLPDLRKHDLFAVWQELVAAGLATANAERISDIIACPGLDYCSLANARSIPIAQMIANRFADLDREEEIGKVTVNISGCINACAHHHIANIGILGVDKKGTESYQVTLGGAADENAALGDVVGPAFGGDRIVDAVETVIDVYLAERRDSAEPFIDTYRRIGPRPSKEKLYAAH